MTMEVTKMENTLNKVTEVISRGRTFIVFEVQNGYASIEDKYFDENGMLTKQFNGLTAHYSDDVNFTVRMTLATIERDYLISTGVDKNVACLMCTGDFTLEEAEELAKKLK